MRVIAGFLGGRNFSPARGYKSQPMSEKTRGAIFSILGDISGCSVLDGFSGSGALAIEAVSRGASRAQSIDSDQNAVSVIKQNLIDLRITSKIKVTKAPLKRWLENNREAMFDLIFLNPPTGNFQISTFQEAANHLTKNGVLVLTWPTSEENIKLDGLKLVQERQYGTKVLLFKSEVSG